MKYILLAVFLFAIELLYIRLAVKYFIVDRPNERSSHTRKTITGGGIIFLIAGLLWFAFNFPQRVMFFAGLALVSVVSFGDDLHAFNHEKRLFSHLVAIFLMFTSFDIFHHLPWYSVIGAFILFAGILNAYNFMDGINGITGLYSISVLGALQWVNTKIINIVPADFIWFPVIACCVFLFFNYRRKAVCFAGDVGSISIAYWIVSVILILIVKTGTAIWLLFLSVYGIDTVLTILHRLYLRQNIFKAHRMHFYQVLANECRIDHRIVSMGYALLQLVISCITIALWDKMNFFALTAIILVPLILIYTLKFRLMKKRRAQSVERRAGPSVKNQAGGLI